MMEGRDGKGRYLLGQVIVLTGSHAGVEVGEEGEHKGRGDLVSSLCVRSEICFVEIDVIWVFFNSKVRHLP